MANLRKKDTKKKSKLMAKIHTSMIGLIGLIHSSVQLNLLTTLPGSIFLQKNDKIGFKVTKFINGSLYETQAFPDPLIQIDDDDQFIHHETNLDNCRMIKSPIELSILGFCKKDREDREKLRFISFDTDSKTVKSRTELDEFKGLDCKDYEMLGDFIFVSCIKKSSSRAFDLVVKSVSAKLNGTQYELEVMDIFTSKNFIRDKESEDISINLKCVYESKDKLDVQCLIFGKRMNEQPHPLSPLRQSDEFVKNILILEFDFLKKRLQLIAFSKGVFDVGPSRIRMVTNNYFYYQRAGTGDLIPCKISLRSKSVVCLEEQKFSISNNDLTMWHFIPNNNMAMAHNSILVLVDQNEFKFCMVDNIPWGSRGSKLNCDSVALDLSTQTLHSLKVNYIYNSMDYNNFFVSYYNSKTNNKQVTLGGYLYVNMAEKRTRFFRTTPPFNEQIIFLNNSYYYIKGNSRTFLMKRGSETVTLQPPLLQDSQNVMFSIHPSRLSKHLENYTRSLVVSSSIHKMKDIYDDLNYDHIETLSLYNSGWFNLGINSKILTGNLAKVDVNLEGIDIPIEVSTVDRIYTKIVKGSLDDSDIKRIFLAYGNMHASKSIYEDSGEHLITVETSRAYIVTQSMNSEVKVLSCDIIIPEEMRLRNIDLSLHSDCSVVYYQIYENYDLVKVEQNSGYIYFIAIKTFIDDVTGTNRKSMVTVRFDKEFSQIIELEISPFEAFCDLQVFSGFLYSVCAYSYGKSIVDKHLTSAYPESGVILKLVDSSHSSLKEVSSNVVDLAKQGSPSFKMGVTHFMAGTVKTALAVNNHKEDPSILVIDFQGITTGKGAYVSKKIKIREEILEDLSRKGDLSHHNVKICPTLSSIFIFSKTTYKIYGINSESMENSYIQVPLANRRGEERRIKKLRCNERNELFQIWVKEKYSGKNLILSYYGFGGLLGSKKLYNELELDKDFDNFKMLSIGHQSDGLVFTFLYDRNSIYYNQTYLVDYQGPYVRIKTDNLYSGKYMLDLKVSNPGNEIDSRIRVKIFDLDNLKIKVKRNTYYPINIEEFNPIEKFVNYTGLIYDIKLHDDKLDYLVEIEKPLEIVTKNNSFYLEENEKFLSVTEDMVMTLTNNTTMSLRNNGELFASVDLKTYGKFCNEFQLYSMKTHFVAVFVCTKQLDQYFYVLKVQRLATRGAYFRLVANIKLEYEIMKVKEDIQYNTLLISCLERVGSRMTVWKLDIDMQGPIERVEVKWRRPGNNNQFSFTKFYPKIIGEFYVLVILIPGKCEFDIIVLDFERSSIKNIITAKGEVNSPFYFIKCNEDFDDKGKEHLNCFAGGVGIFFEQFRIDVCEGSLTKPAKIGNYKLPHLKNYQVTSLKAEKNHLLIKGDFGYYKTKGQDVLKEDVKQLAGLIYKIGDEKLKTYVPLGVTDMNIMRKGEEEFLIGITEENGFTKITKQRIQSGYKIKITPSSNEFLDKLRRKKLTLHFDYIDSTAQSLQRTDIEIFLIEKLDFNLILLVLVLTILGCFSLACIICSRFPKKITPEQEYIQKREAVIDDLEDSMFVDDISNFDDDEEEEFIL